MNYTSVFISMIILFAEHVWIVIHYSPGMPKNYKVNPVSGGQKSCAKIQFQTSQFSGNTFVLMTVRLLQDMQTNFIASSVTIYCHGEVILICSLKFSKITDYQVSLYWL